MSECLEPAEVTMNGLKNGAGIKVERDGRGAVVGVDPKLASALDIVKSHAHYPTIQHFAFTLPLPLSRLWY